MRCARWPPVSLLFFYALFHVCLSFFLFRKYSSRTNRRRVRAHRGSRWPFDISFYFLTGTSCIIWLRIPSSLASSTHVPLHEYCLVAILDTLTYTCIQFKVRISSNVISDRIVTMSCKIQYRGIYTRFVLYNPLKSKPQLEFPGPGIKIDTIFDAFQRCIRFEKLKICTL